MTTCTEALGSLFNDEEFSDVKFELQKLEESDENLSKFIHAHSNILAKRSSVFYDIFKNAGKVPKLIPITQNDSKYFEELIRFIYTDKCNFTRENSFELIRLGIQYKVELLPIKCKEFIINNLNISCANNFLNQSIDMDDVDLIESILDFISDNFSKLLMDESFLTLSYNSLIIFLRLPSIDLNVSEAEVFGRVIKWAEMECQRQELEVTVPNKRKVLDKIIYQIRFPTMKPDEVVDCLADEDGLLSPSEYIGMLKAVIKKNLKCDFEDCERFQNVPDEMCSEEIWHCFNKDLTTGEEEDGHLKSDCVFTVNKRILLTKLYAGCDDYQFNIKIFSSLRNSSTFNLIFDCGREYKDIESGGAIINYLNDKKIILIPSKKYKIQFNSEPNFSLNGSYSIDKLEKAKTQLVSGVTFKFEKYNVLLYAIIFKKIISYFKEN